MKIHSTFFIFAALGVLTHGVQEAWTAPPPENAVAIQPQKVTDQIEVDRVTDGTIYFTSVRGNPPHAPLKTQLHGVEVVTILRPSDGSRENGALLISARPCADCQDQHFIYLIELDGNDAIQLVHPGRVRDRRNGKLLFDGRAFYGACLPQRKNDVLVMFQKEKVDRRRYLQSSVFVAEIRPEGIHEELVVRGRPRISKTLRSVRKKKCVEVKGIDRRTISFRLKPPEQRVKTTQAKPIK